MSNINEAKEQSKHLGDYLPKPRVEIEINTTELEAVVEKIEKLTARVEKAVILLDKLTNNKFTSGVKI